MNPKTIIPQKSGTVLELPRVRLSRTRKAVKFTRWLGREIATTSGHPRRKLIQQWLKSFDVRLASAVKMNNRRRRQGRSIIRDETIWEIAETLSLYRPIREDFKLHIIEKPNRGFRYIYSYGPQRRVALQILADLLKIFETPHQAAYCAADRGLIRAARDISTAIEDGYDCIVRFDIHKFYNSLHHAAVRQRLPLPAKIIDSVILVDREFVDLNETIDYVENLHPSELENHFDLYEQTLNDPPTDPAFRLEIEELQQDRDERHALYHFIHNQETSNVGPHNAEMQHTHMLTDAHTGDPRDLITDTHQVCSLQGIPQGAATSPQIAAMFAREVADDLAEGLDVRAFFYEDDFLVACRTRDDAELVEARVDGALRLNSGGALKTVKRSPPTRASQGFEHLGYRFKLVRGKVQVRPTEQKLADFHEQEIRLRLDKRPRGRQKHRSFLMGWTNAAKPWPGAGPLRDSLLPH